VPHTDTCGGRVWRTWGYHIRAPAADPASGTRSKCRTRRLALPSSCPPCGEIASRAVPPDSPAPSSRDPYSIIVSSIDRQTGYSSQVDLNRYSTSSGGSERTCRGGVPRTLRRPGSEPPEPPAEPTHSTLPAESCGCLDTCQLGSECTVRERNKDRGTETTPKATLRRRSAREGRSGSSTHRFASMSSSMSHTSWYLSTCWVT
jgi:hypothetical protein